MAVAETSASFLITLGTSVRRMKLSLCLAYTNTKVVPCIRVQLNTPLEAVADRSITVFSLYVSHWYSLRIEELEGVTDGPPSPL